MSDLTPNDLTPNDLTPNDWSHDQDGTKRLTIANLLLMVGPVNGSDFGHRRAGGAPIIFGRVF
jgi:hypothetical protein